MLHAILAALQQIPTSPLGQLLTYGAAFATSWLLSKAKTLDTSVTNNVVFRKLQPVITLGGAYIAPYLASHVGVQVDPSAFAAAPLATITAVVGAELLSIIKRST